MVQLRFVFVLSIFFSWPILGDLGVVSVYHPDFARLSPIARHQTALPVPHGFTGLGPLLPGGFHVTQFKSAQQGQNSCTYLRSNLFPTCFATNYQILIIGCMGAPGTNEKFVFVAQRRVDTILNQN
jgi:hypothetical protein